jgi:hypothetical protein
MCKMKYQMIAHLVFVLAGLMTFALGVFVASQRGPQSGCDRPVLVGPESPQWQVLLSFQNRDLKKLDKQSEARLRIAIDSVGGGIEAEEAPWGFQPILFQALLNTAGQQRYLLVEEANTRFVPGTSYLRLRWFDLDGKVLNARTASVYRELFTGVHVRKVDAVRGDMLVVESMYMPFGRYQPRQFYALVENEIRLVYIELNGRFDPTISADGIAPHIKRPVDEWELALFSEDYVEVMSALLWINANHWTGVPMHYDEKEGETVETLLKRNDIRQRLRQLKQSTNPWMKTAARSILNTL